MPCRAHRRRDFGRRRCGRRQHQQRASRAEEPQQSSLRLHFPRLFISLLRGRARVAAASGTTIAADADLRVRVRGVRLPLRGAGRGRGRGRGLRGVWLGADATADLRLLPAGTTAAGGRVRADESRRRERESARQDRIAESRKKRAAGESGPGAGRGGDAEARRERLVELYKEVADCPLSPLRDPDQGGLRRRQRRRRVDVRRRGAGRRRGPPGAAVRRPRRPAAERAPGRDRALARGRLHLPTC